MIELIYITFYIVSLVLEVLLVRLEAHLQLLYNVKLVNSVILGQSQILLILFALQALIHLMFKRCQCKIAYLVHLVNIVSVMEQMVLKLVLLATIVHLELRFPPNTLAQEEHTVLLLD